MLGMKEKLELTGQLNHVTRQLKSGELGMMERLKLSGERNTILAKLKSNSEENELITKYKAGDFNNTKPAEFVEIMRDVHTNGLPLDDVKQGAISWFGANPNLIANKAA